MAKAAWTEGARTLPLVGARRSRLIRERHHLTQGEGGRELGAETVHEPVADAPAVLVVVEGEAGLLEDGEVAPDGAHGAAELARRLIHGEPVGVVQEADQPPLPRELVTAHHRPSRGVSKR